MRWSYKTVHFELKKEGLLGNSFLDESEVEQSLNEYGKSGWELVSLLETMDGLIAVFKQPLSLEGRQSYSFSDKTSRARALPKTQSEVVSPVLGGAAAAAKGKAPVSEPFEMVVKEEVALAEELVAGVVILDESSIIDEPPVANRRERDLKKDAGDIRIE